MEVYVKGMKMPKNCSSCPLSVLSENRLFCERTSNAVVKTKIDRDCPLVPVPEPHGRLIDADALKVSLAYAKETAKWSVPLLRTVLMIVDKIPTIIPASEEGD